MRSALPRSRGQRSILALAACSLMLPSVGSSQAMITLEGIVLHEGAGLPRVQVTVIHTSTGERRTTIATELGYFRFLDLNPGRHEVTGRRLGYTPVSRVVHLAVGQRASLSLTLHREAVLLETIAVHEQTQEVAELQRTSVSTAVTEQEIRELPLNTRNVMELAAIAPGIRSYRPATGRALPTAGALRGERFLNLYLDGLEMKNLYDGNLVGMPQTGSPLPADGLQEFRVFLNPYDAEYARAAAYVISAVTRRGTNERHASVFGYYQDKQLVSVNDFQRSIPNFTRPDFRRQQAGFNLRGPLVRDRLFYSLSYELSNTAHHIAVNPGRPASDPSHWDSYAGVFRAPNRNHASLLRLTYAASEASTFDAIWSLRGLTGEWLFGDLVARNAAVVQRYGVNTVNLRHRWTPSSQLANELSLQWVGWLHRERPLVPGPELIYQSLSLGRSASRMEIEETQLRLVNRISVGIGSGPGSHLLKAGVEIGRVEGENFFSIFRYGRFVFPDVNTLPSRALIAVGVTDPETDRDAGASLSGWVIGTYVNDEWRLGRRVLLNLGLRYDAELNTLNNKFTVPWVEDPALSGLPELRGYLNEGNRRNDLNNVSPRLSLSWDALGSGRIFLRGGWGIIYDRVPAFVGYQERTSATWRVYVFPNPGTTDPEVLRARVLAGEGRVPPSMVLLPRRLEAPENRQWSAGAGIQLTKALTLNTDYVDQDVRKIFSNVNVNWLDVSQQPPRRVLSPDYSDIILWSDFSRARYSALLTRLTYAPSRTGRVDLAHTFGFARAEWDLANNQTPAGVADQYFVMQRTSEDERHRFVLSGMDTLSFGLGISAIATVASPRPYRTQLGQDLNRNSFEDDDWIDGRRYATPTNAWRNWYRVVDVRLTQPLGFGRDRRVMVTAEAFNVFNTENYAGFFGVKNDSDGQPRPDFGRPSSVFAPRQLQVGARLEF